MEKMLLSLDTSTFAVLKEQFDRVLNKTIGNMEMKGADTASVTLKLDIELDKTSRDTGNGMKDFTMPKFKHTVSSVMQVKDKATGEMTGDYAMTFDSDSGQYVLQKIDDGQQDLFEEPADYEDVPYSEIPALEEGTRGLPEPAEADEDDGDEITSDDADSGDDGDSSEYHDGEEPENVRRFAWLSQFIGDTLNITESMGNYTVRNSRNKVVLSSATTPSNPFYCDADTLARHVCHALACAGYNDDEDQIVRIAIECPECGETLFSMKAPWAEGDDSSDEDNEESGYEYDPPEE